MRCDVLVLLVAILVSIRADAECRTPVEPASVLELPKELSAVRAVAWLDDNRLLIGTASSGIVQHDLATRRTSQAISRAETAEGLAEVEDLDSDGSTVVAYNLHHVSIAYNLKADRMLTKRQSARMRVMDVAVRGANVAILGYSHNTRAKGGPLWAGKSGGPWEEYRLLYDPSQRNDAKYLMAVAPYAGAIAFADDLTVAFITPIEAGVRRYRLADGAALPILGADMTALVNDLSAATLDPDLEKRYRQFNRHATIDDLVVLNSGPAVVVRSWSDGRTRWSLWFPSESSATRRVSLGVTDSRAVGAHLRCDGRAWKLACAGASGSGKTKSGAVYLFDLEKAVRDCK